MTCKFRKIHSTSIYINVSNDQTTNSSCRQQSKQVLFIFAVIFVRCDSGYSLQYSLIQRKRTKLAKYHPQRSYEMQYTSTMDAYSPDQGSL